jgi:poly(U)-binding-splicing factor PUF60
MVGVDEIDDALETEVTDECSKYGVVEAVVIYQEKQPTTNDTIVKIFIMFQQTAHAQKAIEALNGRWFGGRRIQAETFDMQKFQAKDYSG